MATSFVHLHNHTEYSRQDGLQRVDAMCAAAAADGQPAIACTDHGSLGAVPSLVKAASAHGLKPILGEEVYLAIGSRTERNTLRDTDDGTEADAGAEAGSKLRRYHHLTLLAATRAGWHNLVRLHNDASAHTWFKPRTDLDILAQHHEGLLIGTGCLGGPVASRFLTGDDEGAYAAARQLLDALGGDKDRLFVEIMSHGIAAEDERVTPKLVELAHTMGLRLVASNDAHYTHGCEHDGAETHIGHGCEPEAHDLLLALGTNAHRDDPNRYRFNGHNYHLRTAEQMAEAFAAIPGAQDAVANSLVIADMVEADVLAPVRTHLPAFSVPADSRSRYEQAKSAGDHRWMSPSHFHLYEKLRAGAEERYGTPLPQRLRDDLNWELEVVAGAGMSDYMLIVADLVEWATEQGIVTGPGRGSAPGSRTAYSLGITDVDPIAHELLFERFLDPQRVGMPDIDTDFARQDRHTIVHRLQETYGADRVALIGTRGTYKAKGSLRDVGRLTSRLEAGAALSGQVWSKAGRDATLAQLTDPTIPESHGFQATATEHPDAPELIALAKTLEGTRSNVGIHACGVLLCDESMFDTVPLRYDAKGEVWVTEWEGGELDKLGYLKLDVLGLRTLDVVSTTVDMIRASGQEAPDITYRGIEVDPDLAPRARKAWDLIAAGDTEGVFQLASDGMKRLARQVAPRSIDDLSALVALYRPGPMGAGMHERYGLRKHGQEEVSYDYLTTDPAEQAVIASVLDDTYGLICYQEQIMQLAGVVAGFGASAKNKLRKAFSKKVKEEMDALEEGFIAGATQVTVAGPDSTASIAFAETTARELWRTFSASADYLFNRCVTGDTIVQASDGSDWTVAELHRLLYGDSAGDPATCPYCWSRPRAAGRHDGRCIECRSLLDLVRRGEFRLLAYSARTGRLEYQPMADVHHNGIRRPVTIRTVDGHTIRASDNHRMLTTHGYVMASQLAGASLIAGEQPGPAGTSPVASVEVAPGAEPEDVYDVEMAEGTDHNFVANGLISHNSHSAVYGFLGYVTAYLKANWPTHFGAATLATTKDDTKRAEILASLRSSGVQVRPPSVTDGQTATWVSPDNAVVIGLSEVDGVGANAKAIVDEREDGGPFTSLSDLVNRVKVVTARQAEAKTQVLSDSREVCHRCLRVTDTGTVTETDADHFGVCTCPAPRTKPAETDEPRTSELSNGTTITLDVVKAGKKFRLRHTTREPVCDYAGQPVLQTSNLSTGVVESLIRAGACDDFGPRQGMLAVVRALRDHPDLPIPDVEFGVIERERVATTKLGTTIGAGPLGDPELVRALMEWKTPDAVRRAPMVGPHRINQPGYVLVGGVLQSWGERFTRAGKKMASFAVADTKASMRGVAWSETLEELEANQTKPSAGDVVVMAGRVNDRTETRRVRLDEDASGDEAEEILEQVTVREISANNVWVFPGDVGARARLDNVLHLPVPQVYTPGGEDPEPLPNPASEPDTSPADPGPDLPRMSVNLDSMNLTSMDDLDFKRVSQRLGGPSARALLRRIQANVAGLSPTPQDPYRVQVEVHQMDGSPLLLDITCAPKVSALFSDLSA